MGDPSFVRDVAVDVVGAGIVSAPAPFVAEMRARALVAGVRFEENARALVGRIAGEVSAGAASADDAEDRLTAAAARLEDPDAAVAFSDALRAGGRNPDPHGHATLAKLVAARLASDTNSAPAVAANLAIRAMESLGAEHLRALALLALVHYAGRPNVAAPIYADLPTQPAGPEYREGMDMDAFNEAQRAYNAVYVAWVRALEQPATAYALQLLERLRRGAERVGVPDEVPESITVHLLAAGCVLRHDSHPELYTALGRPIAPPFPPLGYAVGRAWWGRGLATEAARAAVGWAAEAYGLRRVWASADARNVGSWRVLEKLGFREEARTAGEAGRDGEPTESVVYGLDLGG